MDSYVWHGDTTDKASIINKVARLIRRFVNVVNVHRGSYNDLEISTVVWGDGEVQMFDNLMETIHEEPPGIEFPELLQACLKSGNLWDATGDFGEAIIDPDDTGFHCYRVAERIRRHFLDDEKKAWVLMCEALRLDESWLQWLNKWSKSQRHGDHSEGMSAEDRIEAIRRARVLISRFGHYILRNAGPLQEDEFPLLMG